MGELQVALHIGAWSNGKRLTPEDRQYIMKQLGMKQNIVKNPYQRELEKIGTIGPGQKWWAPTSESHQDS